MNYFFQLQRLLNNAYAPYSGFQVISEQLRGKAMVYDYRSAEDISEYSIETLLPHAFLSL